MPENLAVFNLKCQTNRPNHRVICLKESSEMANSEDPDQMFLCVYALFAKKCMSENLGSLG